MITVVHIEKHRIMADGVRAILSSCDDFKYEANFENLSEGLAHIDDSSDSYEARVVILGTSVADESWIEGTRYLSTNYTDQCVLMLTMKNSPEFIRSFLDAGASGFILSDSTRETVIAAVRAVAMGDSYLGSGVLNKLLLKYEHEDIQVTEARDVEFVYGQGVSDTLTPRQRDIVTLLAEGLNSDEIAAKLHISPNTVKAHRAKIMAVTGVKNTVELVLWAVKSAVI